MDIRGRNENLVQEAKTNRLPEDRSTSLASVQRDRAVWKLRRIASAEYIFLGTDPIHLLLLKGDIFWRMMEFKSSFVKIMNYVILNSLWIPKGKLNPIVWFGSSQTKAYISHDHNKNNYTILLELVSAMDDIKKFLMLVRPWWFFRDQFFGMVEGFE